MAHILLVHAHPTIRYAVKSYLQRCEHTVTTAARARDALEVTTSELNLVVTDIALPGMSCLGLIHALRERSVFAPVILMSERFPHAEEAAAAAFVLTKPFGPVQLGQAIDSALGRISAGQAVAVG